MFLFNLKNANLLPSATKLRRLCFYRRVSVHRGGEYLTRYTPTGPGTSPGQVHPPVSGTHPPADQVHPQAGTLPRDQVHPPGPGTTPWTRYTPRAGTPPQARTPWIRYTPLPPPQGTPPGRYPPRDTATAADGTHPTGMHSCSKLVINYFDLTWSVKNSKHCNM